MHARSLLQQFLSKIPVSIFHSATANGPFAIKNSSGGASLDCECGPCDSPQSTQVTNSRQPKANHSRILPLLCVQTFVLGSALEIHLSNSCTAFCAAWKRLTPTALQSLVGVRWVSYLGAQLTVSSFSPTLMRWHGRYAAKPSEGTFWCVLFIKLSVFYSLQLRGIISRSSLYGGPFLKVRSEIENLNAFLLWILIEAKKCVDFRNYFDD